jgi:hypothetical protein
MQKLKLALIAITLILLASLLFGCASTQGQSQNTSTSMYCGNGVCQKGFPIGETLENCPKDCSEQQQQDQNYWKIKEDLQKQKDDANSIS